MPPVLKPKTQNDILQNELAETPSQITERLNLPGIDKLHQQPFEDIGLVLANVLKSRGNIVSFKYVVGSHVEITYSVTPGR